MDYSVKYKKDMKHKNRGAIFTSLHLVSKFFMKKNLFFVFLLIFLPNILSSCPSCNIQIPFVEFTTYKNISKDKVSYEIEWKFTEDFTQQLLSGYSSMSKKETIKQVKNDLESYMKEQGYLTVIKYDNNKTYNIDKIEYSIMSIRDNNFYYNFTIDTNLTKNQSLFIDFIDDGYNFLFIEKPVAGNKLKEKLEINKTNTSNGIGVPNAKILPKKLDTTISNTKDNTSTFVLWLSKQLKQITDEMKQLIKNIKQSNSISSYAWLLLFSFGYGVLHAIGPGHGKSLVSAYFFSNNSSYFKAFNMSMLIGVVHTFSAFILTFVLYFVMNNFLSSYFKDIELVVTKISAVIIVFIALYLLYKKLKKKKLVKFSATRHIQEHSCECQACKTTSSDWGVVLSAGIIPCAGTVTIFIFTMSMSEYFIGFISAFFMSLGMSLIIFTTALISIKIRSKSSSNTKIIKFLEYGSLIFILFLGIALFFVK